MAGLALPITLAAVFALPVAPIPKNEARDPGEDEVLLGIVLIEEETLPPAAKRAMQTEIERLFRMPGLQLQWTTLEGTFGRTVSYTKLVVVRVRAQDEDARGVRVCSCARSLGSTQIVDNAILPFVQIFVRPIEHIVSRSIRSEIMQRNLWLGRALGRVLAHELYHVLANTREHGVRGLTQPYFETEDLLWRSEGFHPDELRRMWERGLAPRRPSGPRR